MPQNPWEIDWSKKVPEGKNPWEADWSNAAPESSQFSDVQSGHSTTPPSMLDLIKRSLIDEAQPLVGMAQKVGSTVQAGGQWLGDIPRQIQETATGTQIPGNVYASARPNVGTAPRMTPTGRDPFAARNPGQQAGQVLGDIGMGTAAAVASSGASLPAQVAVGGLTGAMLNPDAPKIPAALGMAAPIATRGVSAVVNRLPSNKLTAPLINKWIGANPTEMSHGADPGAQILEENLLGSTKTATHTNVMAAFKDSGNQLDDLLKAADATGKTIDNSDALLEPLANATKGYGAPSEKVFKDRLDEILKKALADHPNVATMTPSETQELSKELGKSIKWTGTPYQNEVNQVLVKMRGAVSDNLKSNVQDIEPALRRWGNLKQATDALSKSITRNKSGLGTSSALPKPLTDALKSTARRVAPYVIGGAIGGGVVARGIRGLEDLIP